MIKKTRLVLIAILAFIAFVCIFAGCNLNPTLDEVLGDLNKQGAVVEVTYFANEGKFNSNTKITNMRCKVGSKAVKIGEDDGVFESGTIFITYTKYRLVGWYEAEIDTETGYPVYNDGSIYKFSYDPKGYDDTKTIRHTGELFDFNTKLEKDTHYYLVAEWEKIEVVQVKLAGEVESIDVTPYIGEPVTYKKGDVINEIGYSDSSDGKVISAKPTEIMGTVKDGTFIEFYYHESCEKDDMVTWPLYFNDHGDKEYTIYAKYIEGLWTVVRDRDGVERMFSQNSSASYRYYIFDDINCDISQEGEAPEPLEVKARTGSNGFGCEINGNGHTISGLKVVASFSRNQTSSASLFGAIKSSAIIRDITFEIEEVYTVNTNASALGGIYFAFTSIADEAKKNISGVVISGTMVVNGSTSQVPNLRGGAENNWKFGSYGNDSDYSGGITVNATLTVNEN